MPSASRISRIASETSSSSRETSRAAFSTTVTSAPKPPKNLRELEADIASANDDKAPGQGVEFKQRRVGQRPHLIATRKIGNDRPAADIDEEALGLEHVVADLDCRGRKEARVASDERAIRHAFAARS